MFGGEGKTPLVKFHLSERCPVKVGTVVGARPQFIKAAAVSRALRSVGDVQEVIIHTGQHYDANMSEVFFQELEIPRADHHLGIGSDSHGAQTGRMLEALEQVLIKEKPDQVLVYGDTNSTLAGALAAAKLQIPVAHIEAGLRSFNRRMAEETNRILTDHASTLLFAPTDAAVVNLRREGISTESIHHVGDVMYDAALYYGAKAEATSRILGRLGLKAKHYSLVTVHRAETTDTPARLYAVAKGLCQASGHMQWVFPVHPRTRTALMRDSLLEDLSRCVRVIEPVGYLDMVMLEKNSCCIATDSGGVQKEAFFYRVPCVTLREETEWVELVELGWNRLVSPTDSEAVAKVLSDSSTGTRACRIDPGDLYGDGHAAERIAGILLMSS